MPTNRKRRRRSAHSLKLWEYAYLSSDESGIVPGTRDALKLKILKRDPDGFLFTWDRTARQLVKEFPQYGKKID